MQINVHIDKLTDCLIERATGRIVDTEYIQREELINSSENLGWQFDWRKTQEEGYTIYELFVKDDDIVQGRMVIFEEAAQVLLDKYIRK